MAEYTIDFTEQELREAAAKKRPKPVRLGVEPQYSYKCSVEFCSRCACTRGLCEPHYKRAIKYGNPLGDIPIRAHRPQSAECVWPDCEETKRSSPYGFTRGFCDKHWKRVQRWMRKQASEELT